MDEYFVIKMCEICEQKSCKKITILVDFYIKIEKFIIEVMKMVLIENI